MSSMAVEITDLIEICINSGMIPNLLKSLTILFKFEMQRLYSKIVASTQTKGRAYVMILNPTSQNRERGFHLTLKYPVLK